MKIIQGKYAGFCPGVKRAWALIEKELKGGRSSIFVLGELIHNRQAIRRLADWGVRTVDKLSEIKEKEGTIFIRAHGEPPETYQKLERMKGFKVVDATCPSVTRVQTLAQKTEDVGYQVFVCGEKDHPEAKATVGYTKKGKILPSVEAAQKVRLIQKIGVLSQTTFSAVVFEEICAVLKKKCVDFHSLGTICNFVQLAQKEARKIAEGVDLVIVVGGRQSSNTKRLVEAARELKPTYHIETVQEIEKGWLRGAKIVGLLAGASTPAWIIEEVKERINHN